MACEQHDLKSKTKLLYSNICRICLESGEIPIFGGEEKPDLSPEISAFAAIKVCQTDEMPQHMCNSCYTLLQNAILFREMAKKSEIAIKYQKTLMEEEKLCIDEENANDSIRSITKHYSDHNYSKREAFDTGEQSCNSRNSNDSDSGSELILLNTSESDPIFKNNVVSSSTEKSSEKENTITSCKVCNINFETPVDCYEHELTTAHIYNEKNMGRIECNICKSTMNRSYYLTHLINHSLGLTPVSGNKMCRICNKMLLSDEDIRKHRNSEEHKTAVKTASKIQCPVCHIIVQRIELKKHLSRHASEVANRVKKKCPICNKIMSYSYYITHLERKHNINLVNETLEASLSNVDKNSETEIDDDNKDKTTSTVTKTKKYICDVCGKVFYKACILRAHRLIHGGEKKFICDLCPYRGLTKSLLQTHLKVHMGMYNFECDLCPGAKFLSKSNLIKHIKRHSGIMDFKCKSCHKDFHLRRDLRNHIEVVHLGMRKHVCHLCNNSFTYRGALNTHLMNVHNHSLVKRVRCMNHFNTKLNKNNK